MKSVKKVLVSLFLAFALLARVAHADTGSAFIVLNGVTTNTTSTTYNVSKVSYIRVRAWSTAGSVADISVQGRTGVSTSEPWYVLDSTSNVDNTTGWYEYVPVTMQIRVVVQNYFSGTIYVVLETHQISP